jgi:hypothetical protein
VIDIDRQLALFAAERLLRDIKEERRNMAVQGQQLRRLARRAGYGLTEDRAIA